MSLPPTESCSINGRGRSGALAATMIIASIDLMGGNAVQLLARALHAAGPGFRLASFQGGNKHNALAREAAMLGELARSDGAVTRASVPVRPRPPHPQVRWPFRRRSAVPPRQAAVH